MGRDVVGPREVFRLIRAGARPVVIDVRERAEFFAVRAEGSRSVPLRGLEPAAVMRGAPAEEPVYVLCQTGKWAAKAVERFGAAGYRNARVVAGGLVGWERAGLPGDVLNCL